MRKTLLRLAGILYTGLVLALVLAAATQREAPLRESEEGEEVPAALARKLAKMATFAPASASLLGDDPFGAADQDWLEHAAPGNDVSSSELAEARKDWQLFNARPARGGGAWESLGPTNGVSPFNPYRDRGVYNAGTPNFSGRTVAGAIDPNCSDADCRLWIGNANGGVWMTHNALAREPTWEFVSRTFEHNSVAALELDPNDPRADTLWAGTGEPNACGSGCEAGVGLYLTTNGGKSWKGPIGLEHFENRAVGSIAVRAGNSDVVFAASGRAGRGISNTCCGGVDQLIPGAPHFGLYRTLDGGNSWELVHQGAPELCTASSPDAVAMNQTPCSPRGARRVIIDPVDQNTVYVSLFARGIWRSKSNGDPGTWEQIMAPLGPVGSNERAEFDVIELPGGETRMYVGVGGGSVTLPGPPPVTAGLVARFRRNDAVRTVPGATVQAAWIDLTNFTQNTPGYSSRGYCDPQCSYDNYVYVPPGADANTVYLSGSNQYAENDYVFGRSNGRAVLLSTDAGATFTDMTEDDTDQDYPVALHPDHHALVTNPNNWQQFFDFGDGGVARSNGVFINDAGDCVSPKAYTGARLTFCQLVLSRVPQRIDAINNGLRTLHFYEINYNRHSPDEISGGTQDNGSWETLGDHNTWINTNIADGGHNSYDAPGGDPNFKLTGWQAGQLEVSFEKQNQVDVTWIADTLFVFYGSEASPFIASAITDPVTPGWLWTGREHVFRSTNYGMNPVFGKATVREHCNVWFGDGDLDGSGTYQPAIDICDDWEPLGDPGPNGRLTSATFGARAGGHVALVERGKDDTSTVWAATSTGRVFISKNANNPAPAAVTFIRLDSTDPDAPPRYPTALFVDPADANHAWITYSGYNAKTPDTPGHVFEIRYVPGPGNQPGTGQFTLLDGHKNNGYGDIPANSIIVSDAGTIYVGNDFGVVLKEKNSPVWHRAAAGLPNVDVADLVYVPERGVLYAATHGQGVWKLKVH